MSDLKLAFKFTVDTAAAATGIGRFVSRAKGEINSLGASAKSTGSQMDSAFAALGIRSTAAIRAELQKTRAAYVAIAKDGKSSLGDIRAATAALKSKTHDLNQELAGNKLGELNRQMAAGVAPAKSYAGGIGAVAHKMLAYSAAVVSVRQGLDLVKGIIKTGAAFETLGAQLKTLYGNSNQAEQALGWIQQFTKDTPFQLDGVTQGFIKLKAFGLDPMDGTMQAIVDQSSALGASQENLQGIVLALGQAWTKQKLQGDEILQLVNQGVPVWDLLAKVTGKTTAELQKLSQQGALGRDVIRALIDEMGRVNAGASAEQMRTFNGQLSNLQDTWTQFENTIAKSGLLDYLKSELDAINSRMAEMAATGELKTRAKEIADALISMIKTIKAVGVTLFDLRQEIGLVVAAWLGFKALKGSAALFDATSIAVTRLATRLRLLKTAEAASGIQSMGKGAASALPPMRALTLLRFAPWVGLAMTVAYLYQAKKAADEAYAALQRAKRDKIDTLNTTADINAAGVGTAVASRAELAKMTAYARANYAERLAQAHRFYAAKVALATTDTGTDPAQARANLENKHLYDQALADLKKYQSSSLAAQTQFNGRLNAIKTGETQLIERAINDQIAKYKQANAELQRLSSQRADIEARFSKSANGLAAPKDAKAPGIVAVGDAVQKAQGLLQDGELKNAEAAAEQARQLIEAASAAGTVSSYFLEDYLNRAKEVALAANSGQQEAVQKQIEGYKASIEALKSAADWMKQLTIGFDADAARKSTEQLQAELQALMSKNPLVQKVVLQKPDGSLKNGSDIVNEAAPVPKGYATGGLITGPGTGTSDSIIARLSAGEFVQKHAAVQYYGTDFMHAINNLKLPRFANGGPVLGAAGIPANISIPSMTRPPVSAAGGGASGGDTLYLTIGGQQIGPVSSQPDVTEQFKRAAAMFGAAR